MPMRSSCSIHPGADDAARRAVRLEPGQLTTAALRALLRHWRAAPRPAPARPAAGRIAEAGSDAAALPERSAFRFETLLPWLGRLAIFGRLADGDWRVRLDGSDIVAETGIDWTGLTAREIERRYGVTLCNDLDVCAEGARPVAQRLAVYNEDHRTAERLLLPVAAGDGTVQIFLALYPVPADPEATG